MYIPANINWNAAEIKCKCQGTLAILDTKEEMDHFLSEMYIYISIDSGNIKLSKNFY